MSEPIIVKGNASDISVWDDSYECSGQPRDLYEAHWAEWHQALVDKPHLHESVGGTKLVKKYKLMYIGPLYPGDPAGPAYGWPIYEYGKPVNIVRRFFRGERRYRGVGGRGIQLWPDIKKLPSTDTHIALVAGMRDASFARAAGIHAFTSTGGVSNWKDEWLQRLSFRRAVVCFDTGREQEFASKVADYLRFHGHGYHITVATPPHGFKDVAELGEVRGLDAIRQLLGGK